MPQLSPGRAIRISIGSIIRQLFIAMTVSAIVAATLLLVGLTEIAVPFLLAATIAFGLTVISVAWLALTRAHPGAP